MALERDIGRHDEAIETLKEEVSGLRSDIAEIKAILATAQGSWKTLLAIGAIAGSVGAAAVKLLGMMKGGL